MLAGRLGLLTSASERRMKLLHHQHQLRPAAWTRSGFRWRGLPDTQSHLFQQCDRAVSAVRRFRAATQAQAQ